MYGAAHTAGAVLSLPNGITVWCRDGGFAWRGRDGIESRALVSEVEVVGCRLLAALAR